MVRNTFGCFSWDISVCKHSLMVNELNINKMKNANITKTNSMKLTSLIYFITLTKKYSFEQYDFSKLVEKYVCCHYIMLGKTKKKFCSLKKRQRLTLRYRVIRL